MTAEQCTRQAQAIHIQFKRLVSEGAIAETNIYVWASQIIGRLVPSLKICEDSELNLLRDVVNGKSPKLLDRAQNEFKRLGINHPDAYIAKMSEHESGNFRRWKGHTLATLPMWDLYRLCQTLETRVERAPASVRQRRGLRYSGEKRRVHHVDLATGELFG